jgi:mannose-6-phosphate isomerase-like protein (cupin superfamily)
MTAAVTPLVRMHDHFARLAALAAESHARGRDPFAPSPRDIGIARLYCHAFRRHVIGAFHATRRELEGLATAGPAVPHVARAIESLADLADRSMDPVARDARALLSSFHFYAAHVSRAVESLTRACETAGGGRAALDVVRARFVAEMEAITATGGLVLTRDTAAPVQASFVVPNLGITIVPLVYGDHHSWNIAWLVGPRSDVPFHLHRAGVEIHLGYGPLHGHTILGDAKAEVVEGYAMPIPPGTRHGYVNVGDLTHHVPFVFGSLALGGWGVFLDVDARPTDAAGLAATAVTDPRMNGMVLLEREIAAAAAAPATARRTLIPAARTDRDGSGGIVLSIATVAEGPLTLESERFRAVSVVRGRGTLSLCGETAAVAAHDHFGIPGGLPATIHRTGPEPLVLLDTTIEPAGEPTGASPAG